MGVPAVRGGRKGVSTELAVLQSAVRDASESARHGMAQALSKQGSAALPTVRWFVEQELSRGGSDAGVLRALARTLGELGALDDLRQLYANPRAFALRAAVLEAIGRCGSAALSFLRGMKPHNEDEQIWLIAAFREVGEPAIRDLLAILEKRCSVRTRMQVADALGRCGASAVPHLRDLISRDADPQVIESAAYALSDIGERGIAPLHHAARTWKSGAPTCFVDALGATRNRHAVRPLIALYRAIPSVRQQAAEALGECGGRRARAFLDAESTRLSGSASVSLAAAVHRALERLTNRRATIGNG